MNSKPSKESKFKSNAVRVLILVLVITLFVALIVPGVFAKDTINLADNYQPGFIRGTTQSINFRLSPAPPATEQSTLR